MTFIKIMGAFTYIFLALAYVAAVLVLPFAIIWFLVTH